MHLVIRLAKLLFGANADTDTNIAITTTTRILYIDIFILLLYYYKIKYSYYLLIIINYYIIIYILMLLLLVQHINLSHKYSDCYLCGNCENGDKRLLTVLTACISHSEAVWISDHHPPVQQHALSHDYSDCYFMWWLVKRL